MNVGCTEKDQNKSSGLLHESLACRINKLYSKDEMIKSPIDTQTFILDTVTTQQSTQYFAHDTCSLVETSLPNT